MKVARWNEERDGALTEEALRRQIEARGYRTSRLVYEPGTRFPEHEHDVDKINGVLSGRFRFEAGGEEVVLEPGDRLEIPKGTRHAAEVVGEEAVVALDAKRR